MAEVVEAGALSAHAELLCRAARTGSARADKAAAAAGAPASATAGASTGGADGGARAALKERAPLRTAALRALAKAWAAAAAAEREAAAAHTLACAEACALSDWDVRTRALELLGVQYGALDPAGTALPPSLGATDAARRALRTAADALGDGKFVAVRNAGVRAMRALVRSLPDAAATELAPEAIRALEEAAALERDSKVGTLLAEVRADATARQRPEA